jgi:hypothetical protein
VSNAYDTIILWYNTDISIQSKEWQVPVERISAEDVVGIASLNAAVMSSTHEDGTDDIVIIVPDGLHCQVGLHPVEDGDVLYIVGESADIVGGIRLQVGHLEGGIHGNLANEVIQVLVPAHRHIPKVNWAPGMTNWTT